MVEKAKRVVIAHSSKLYALCHEHWHWHTIVIVVVTAGKEFAWAIIVEFVRSRI